MSVHERCYANVTGSSYEYSIGARVLRRTLVAGADSSISGVLFFFSQQISIEWQSERRKDRGTSARKDMSHDSNSSTSPSSTDQTPDDDARDEYLARWEIAVLTSIFLITLIGNIMILLALYARRRYQRRKLTRMYFFILHLSIADLLTGLLDVLPQLAWDITFR